MLAFATRVLIFVILAVGIHGEVKWEIKTKTKTGAVIQDRFSSIPVNRYPKTDQIRPNQVIKIATNCYKYKVNAAWSEIKWRHVDCDDFKTRKSATLWIPQDQTNEQIAALLNTMTCDIKFEETDPATYAGKSGTMPKILITDTCKHKEEVIQSQWVQLRKYVKEWRKLMVAKQGEMDALLTLQETTTLYKRDLRQFQHLHEQVSTKEFVIDTAWPVLIADCRHYKALKGAAGRTREQKDYIEKKIAEWGQFWKDTKTKYKFDVPAEPVAEAKEDYYDEYDAYEDAIDDGLVEQYYYDEEVEAVREELALKRLKRERARASLPRRYQSNYVY
eukprot:365907_1